MEYIDREEVIQIIQDLGYISKFNSKERFYKIKEEQVGKYKTGVNYKIPNPRIGTYEDIEEILKISFEMYDDFKKALMKSQS